MPAVTAQPQERTAGTRPPHGVERRHARGDVG